MTEETTTAAESEVKPAKKRGRKPAAEKTVETKTSQEVGKENLYGPDGLRKDIEYKYDAEGCIDWRAMVPSRFIILNDVKLLEDGIDASVLSESEKEELKATTADKNLFISLAGYKKLAKMRGYTGLTTSIEHVSKEHVVASCSIDWIGNFETNGKGIYVTQVANANVDNTKGVFRHYLEPLAENRALCRAVRTSLGINILGEDETFVGVDKEGEGEEEKTTPDSSIRGALSNYLNANNISFDRLKKSLVASQFEGAESWEEIKDIPQSKILIILERLKKKQKDS